MVADQAPESMDRRRFLNAAGASLAAASGLAHLAHAQPEGDDAIMADRPNILIYMNDQEQALPTLAGHPCSTPNADRLAAEGIRFNRCYTPTAHCCPSRASLMTGLYPSGHGIHNNILNTMALGTDIPESIPMWSESLAEAGYSMKFSGKWHVCCNRDPKDTGWDELLAQATGGGLHGREWEHWEQLAAHRERHDWPAERGAVERPGWGTYRHYGTARQPDGVTHDYNPGDYNIVTTGLQGLEDAAAGADPWCVYIGPNGPHDPYIVPEKYATMYDPAEIPMPESWLDDCRDKPVIYQRQRKLWGQLSPDEQREAVAHYWGYCTMQDDLLGMVLDQLEETGQAENTLVIFLSDHGDYNGAHGLWMKGIPAFDEAYHIPCIMRWPEGIRNPGREVDQFVTLPDLAPTFVELAGGPSLGEIHGRSVAPFLRGEAPEDWTDMFCTQMNGVELYYSQRSVRTEEWKYVFNGFDWDELYYLPEDPHEIRNLAPRGGDPSPEVDEVLREMCSRMWQFARRTGDIMKNPYGTVGLAPYGPMVGLD